MLPPIFWEKNQLIFYKNKTTNVDRSFESFNFHYIPSVCRQSFIGQIQKTLLVRNIKKLVSHANYIARHSTYIMYCVENSYTYQICQIIIIHGIRIINSSSPSSNIFTTVFNKTYEFNWGVLKSWSSFHETDYSNVICERDGMREFVMFTMDNHELRKKIKTHKTQYAVIDHELLSTVAYTERNFCSGKKKLSVIGEVAGWSSPRVWVFAIKEKKPTSFETTMTAATIMTVFMPCATVCATTDINHYRNNILHFGIDARAYTQRGTQRHSVTDLEQPTWNYSWKRVFFNRMSSHLGSRVLVLSPSNTTTARHLNMPRFFNSYFFSCKKKRLLKAVITRIRPNAIADTRRISKKSLRNVWKRKKRKYVV